MNIVILGLPGAGKGTHAQRLKNELKMHHLSSGEILKRKIKQNNKLGRRAKIFVKKGDLVPDNIVIEVIKEKIKEHDGNNLLFDGFPRTLYQAKKLEEIINNIGNEITFCLYIKVRDGNIYKRLSGRRICQNDGTVYHIEFNSPKTKGICDKCGGKLIQRKDDKMEIVKKRVEESKERIMDIVKFYDEKGILETIDGSDKTPDEVHVDVQKVVRQYIDKCKRVP